MRHRLPLLSTIHARLGAAFAAIAVAACTPAATAAATSGVLPSTPVVTIDGASTDLRTLLRGHVALVSFWATWCVACVDEIDALGRLQSQARGDGVIVGVAVGETRETVAAFARKRGVAYAQLVDENFHLADALGEPRVPTTLVVDRGGRIVFRGGALDPAGLAAFRSALAAP